MARTKTQRQARTESLTKRGFLKFEAEALSTIPMNTPYMKGLVIQRSKLHRREYTDVVKASVKWWMLPGQRSRVRLQCQERYEVLVRQLYKGNGWQRRVGATKRGKPIMRDDPWAMLRAMEDRYRAKNPEYTSPGVKRRKRAEADVRERVGKIYGKRRRTPAVKLRYLPGGGAEIVE